MVLLRLIIFASFVLISCADREVSPVNINSDSEKETKSSFGDGEMSFGTGDGRTSEKEEEIDYPIISYYGQGRMDSRAGDSNLFLTIDVNMDKEKIEVKTTNTRSDDDNSDVRNGVRSNDGTQVLKRAKPEKIYDLIEDGTLPDSNMLMYVTELKKKNGQINNFSVPIPFVIVPKSKAEFEKFRKIQIAPIITQVSGAFNGTVKILIQPGSTVSSETDSVRVVYSIQNISYDKNSPQKGNAYQNLGLPESVEYVVDTKKRRIIRMSNISTYFEENGDSWPISNMNLNLCRFETVSSGVENLGQCQ